MTDANEILGITHNLMHAVRCKALARGTAAEARLEAERVEHWDRLVRCVRSIEAQLAAVTAQRDELLEIAAETVGAISEVIPAEPLDELTPIFQLETKRHHWEYVVHCRDRMEASIARAQPEQPQQPPIQQPAAAEPTIQSGEFSFLDQLPKGPALGRFSASERAELDDLKRKAFKAGEP